jgi:2-polyprenyl-6-methoxyphenol hydroxylase-like FAD-dependent oxidoreductase
VIIAGGGPAGSSAAIHLAQSGARVLLVEQKKFPRPKLCGEFISPECSAHFERLGVFERMLAGNPAQLAETVFYSKNGANVSVPSKWFSAGGVALGSQSRGDGTSVCCVALSKQAQMSVKTQASSICSWRTAASMV